METIFDHNPTKEELKHLIGDYSKEEYLEELRFAPKGENLLFITLLYEYRHDKENTKKYKELVPDLYLQWKLSLDNKLIIKKK